MLTARIVKIRGSLPYSLHYDERHLTERARGVMQTGDWNPHWFRYPCLPLYLTTAGMSAGLLRSASNNGVAEVASIGEVATPFYENPEVVFPARALFALLGTLSILLVGLIAWRVTGSALALVVAPTLLAASTLSHVHAWMYLNVDTVGTFFALLAVLHAVRPRAPASLAGDGFLAGALAGLTIGSKYSLYPILLPGLVRIALDRSDHDRGGHDRGASGGVRAAAFLAAAVAVFAITTPGLLDLPAFLDGLAFEVQHYSTGHGAATIDAGLPHLRGMLAVFWRDLGPVVSILASIGVVCAFRADRRRAAVLVVFPVVLLLYLSRQRVLFDRNVLSALPFVAVFAAIGLAAIGAWVRGRPALARRPRVGAAVTAGLVLTVLASLSWTALERVYDPTPDSRRLAVAWVDKNIAPDVTLFVAKELEVDLRSLAGREVVPFSLFDPDVAKWQAVFERSGGAAILVPTHLMPQWRVAARRIETVVPFGRNDVRADVPPAVRGTPSGSLLRPGGDPRLRIGRLR